MPNFLFLSNFELRELFELLGYGLIVCSNQALVFIALFFVLLKPQTGLTCLVMRIVGWSKPTMGLLIVIFHHGPAIPGFRTVSIACLNFGLILLSSIYLG